MLRKTGLSLVALWRRRSSPRSTSRRGYKRAGGGGRLFVYEIIISLSFRSKHRQTSFEAVGLSMNRKDIGDSLYLSPFRVVRIQLFRVSAPVPRH